MRVKCLNKYVYNFEFVIYAESEHDIWSQVPSETFLSDISSLSEDFTKLSSNFSQVFGVVGGDLALDPHCAELFNFLWNDHHKDIVIVCERKEEPNVEDLFELIKDFLYSLINKMNNTAPRYKALLKAYQSKADDLLAQIHSRTTGVARFNDTPQNDGEFEDNSHNTNVNKSEGDVYSDGVTTMARLNEIQEQYRNLIKDWAREFNVFFIAPSNFEFVEE